MTNDIVDEARLWIEPVKGSVTDRINAHLIERLVDEIELLRARVAVLQRKSDDVDEDNILWGPR